MFRGADAVIHMAANPRRAFRRQGHLIALPAEHRGDLPGAGDHEGDRSEGHPVPVHLTVYGERRSSRPLRNTAFGPISVYGATKLACEALICSYAHSFDMNGVIFRFANVVGTRTLTTSFTIYTNKLRADPKRWRYWARSRGPPNPTSHRGLRGAA